MSLKTRLVDPGTGLQANIVKSGEEEIASLATHVHDGQVQTLNDIRTDWYPNPDEKASGSFGPLKVNPDGGLMTRSSILSDEGSFRFTFADTISSSITGRLTFQTGSDVVKGVDTSFISALSSEDYIKLSADGPAAYTQIKEIVSDTELILYEGYLGSTAQGSATTSHFNYDYSGTNALVTQASNELTITSGTTDAGYASCTRDVDYLPVYSIIRGSIDQRIANQSSEIYLGNPYDDDGGFAKIVFEGTDSSTLSFVSGNGDQEQSTDVTLSGGLTTDQELTYEILITNRRCQLTVNSKIVATHVQHVPKPYEWLSLVASMTNTDTVTKTTMAFKVWFLSNENVVSINADYSPVKVEVIDTVGAEIVTTGEGFSRGYVTLSTTSPNQPIRKTTYTTQSTNYQASLASSSASDTSAGTGGRTVQITYYDENLVGPFTETVTLAGTSRATTTATNVCHIESMRLMTAGSGGVAAGIITLYDDPAAGSAVGSIAAGDISTQWCHHFVGVGATTKITSMMVNSAGDAAGKAARFVLRYKNILDPNPVDYPVTEYVRLPGGVLPFQRTFESPIVLEGPGRLLMTVTMESSNAYDALASFSYRET